MTLSVFDIFKIGIGPSSSHTVGPMRAARNFARNLQARGLLDRVAGLQIALYGSLAETGRGHGTDTGIMLGLMGQSPDTVVSGDIPRLISEVQSSRSLSLWGAKTIAFDPDQAFSYRIKPMVLQPNGMRFGALDPQGELVCSERYVSTGGACIRALDAIQTDETVPQHDHVPYPFTTGRQLLDLC